MWTWLTWRRVAALAICVCCWPATARAQFAVAGQVTATAASGDDNFGGYFNYTDYSHNALQMLRVSLSAMWHPVDQLALLAEVRSENAEHVMPYALYVRVRPWKGRAFDIQAGRIPTVFGTFSRRYDADNPLIGVPLAYQYLTTLRPDSVPVSADNLLPFRGLGWEVAYPVGDHVATTGVPLVNSYRWDTGVEAHGATRYIDAALAVTSGTLSNPRVDDDNRGRQVSARVAAKPVIGLVVGASAASGEFLSRNISDFYGQVFPGAHYRQRGLGLDAEYSRGYWIVRGEWIQSRWTLPAANLPYISDPLRATSGYVEAKYRFTPRFYAATRVDHLGFSNITGKVQTPDAPGQPTPWDAPVTRIELGGGAHLSRHFLARTAVQYNWRDRPIRFVASHRFYVAGQLTFTF